ncbi:hypothetical protein [Sphingobium aquiterrae]|uniref:hypothetical protein n=1 Tax=Sphingobium aquiterrae TaxID=2038656 RepID=UPI00301B5365
MNVKPVFLAVTLLSAPVAAQTAAAPPPIQVVDGARRLPAPVFIPSPVPSSSTNPVRAVAVVMMLGTETLWRGTLKVGGGVPARFSLSEPAGDVACDNSLGSFGRQGRQIELSLSAMQPSRAGVTYMLNARYSRPAADQPCGGTRAISLDQRFGWDGNETLRFEGDGGLRITIGKP